MLPVYMKLMCVKSASKIAPILHMLPMFCALPFGAGQPLAPSCPGFNPNPYSKLAPKDCPDHNVFRCARATYHTNQPHFVIGVVGGDSSFAASSWVSALSMSLL